MKKLLKIINVQDGISPTGQKSSKKLIVRTFTSIWHLRVSQTVSTALRKSMTVRLKAFQSSFWSNFQNNYKKVKVIFKAIYLAVLWTTRFYKGVQNSLQNIIIKAISILDFKVKYHRQTGRTSTFPLNRMTSFGK